MVTGNSQWVMVLSAKILVKECMTEAKLEFPDRWGVKPKTSHVGGGGGGGYGYFLESNNLVWNVVKIVKAQDSLKYSSHNINN